MKQKTDRFRGLRAFFSALTAAFALLLLGMGLLTADYNSRRVQDGMHAVQEYGELSRLITMTDAQQETASALGMALPARIRAIGWVWNEERGLTERWLEEQLAKASADAANH